jgi:hypothetical protein
MRIFLIGFVSLILFVFTLQVTQGQGDITPPVVHHKTIYPLQVDTSAGEQTITVTVYVTDDLSGIEYVQVLFQPIAESTQYLAMNTAGNPSDGDPNSDVLDLVGRLPQYSIQGVWRLELISAKDAAGNIIYIDLYDENWPAGDNRFINGEYHELFLPAVAKRSTNQRR